LGDWPVISCHFEIEKTLPSHTGEIFRAEMNLDLNGELLRVEKTEMDMYKAIDKVKDHMEQVIIKFKEKRDLISDHHLFISPPSSRRRGWGW
jgi:ribosomal subunit interface protein